MAFLRSDQRRSVYAYRCVKQFKEGEPDSAACEEYQAAVERLGVEVLRSGLAGALATLQRDAASRKAVQRLFAHLAGADIPGLSEDEDLGPPEQALPEQARTMDLGSYMIATRETLKVAQWFKRAVQATFGRG